MTIQLMLCGSCFSIAATCSVVWLPSTLCFILLCMLVQFSVGLHAQTWDMFNRVHSVPPAGTEEG